MNASEILTAVNAGEDKDWEFKSAKGGLPGSLWETYSAMANTDGGVIVLGVRENDGDFEVQGLDDPAKMEKDFWTTISNRGKVSLNLLSNQDVTIAEVGGKALLVITIQRATRRQRPVFVGQNPVEGTYRRYNDGDYRCSADEVGRMLADQSEESLDARILEHFALVDLDPASLRQYRNVFSARTPNHPWLAESDEGLLAKLGGWRLDRERGQNGLTVAGLLMFGKDEAIRDPAAVPQYQISYREKLSDDPNVRWTDRLTIDGTWVGNLFQFYQRVSVRLPQDVIKTPFALTPGMVRIDDTPGHQALREALVNALIHADFRGQGGIVVEKRRDGIELSNPGSLLISLDQVVQGGISECRNKSLQLMFLMIGGGEREGSGIDKIRQGWASQHFQAPRIEENFRPDRVRLELPTVSLLPEPILEQLRQRFGEAFARLSPLEVQALVIAEQEGDVSNGRMRLACTEHAADLTRVLQGLVGKAYLEQLGQKRGTTYRLPSRASPLAPGATHVAPGGSHVVPGGSHVAPGGSHVAPGGSHVAPEKDAKLLEIAKAARDRPRLAPELTKAIIRELCSGRNLTAEQIGALMGRTKARLQEKFLAEMVEAGDLSLRYPNQPNHPNQAYMTNDHAEQVDGMNPEGSEP